MATEQPVHATKTDNAGEKFQDLAVDASKLEQMSESDSSVSIKDDDSSFPDGGLRAWLVVFGAFCSTFATFGYINTWGAFQAYYQTNTLSHLPASKISIIGSFQDFLTGAVSIFVGWLFDIGHFRVPLFLSSCIIVVATICLAECTKYWQIFLCQAVAIGLASGTMFGSTLPAVSHWFKNRRTTALGITAAGSSVGSALLPIIFQTLTEKIGFKWAMRALGFVFLLVTSCVNIFMRRRLPPTKVEGGIFNPKAFKYAPFTMYVLSTCMCQFGILIVLIYIDISATDAGVPASLAVYLIVIANGVGAIGRITMGILADRVGCLTVLIPLTLLGSIATFLWPLAKSFSSFVGIAIVYGFCSGTFFGLLAAPLIHMGETADVGRRAGMLYSINSLTFIAGPPIAGATISQGSGYRHAGIYGGVTVLVGVVLLWITRYLLTGHIFRGRI